LAKVRPKFGRGYYEKEKMALQAVGAKDPAGTGYIFLFLECYG
jgi:hypothetical protein